MNKFFNKFCPIVIFCILMFCFLPFVSAENTGNINNFSVNENSSMMDSNLIKSNNINVYDWYVSGDVNESGNGSKSHPFKTIQEGLNANGGGQSIYISNGTYFVSNYELNNSVNLIGESNGGTIISGYNDTHIFIINSKIVTVSLNNLTLTNGNTISSQEVGGAIQKNDGVLNINNCIFKNNSAQYGGAIYNLAGTLNVNNSQFSNNTIVNTGCDGGAAIYDLYGTGNFYNCLFIDNLAYKQQAGAIYQNKGYLNVYNTSFINNQASQSGIGGAIFLNDRSYATIVNSLFKGNSAYEAGAIYSANSLNGMIGACLIDNCIFDSNNAFLDGGAILNYWYNSLMTIQNSNFINNTAKEGGAICNQYSTLTLLNNTIKNCNALSMGDNIYNEGILSNVYLIILNNQTIKVVKGQLVNITASLNDDNGNLITGGNIDLIVNNESITNLTVNEGIISYNYNVTKEGKYTVKGNYSQAQNTILKSSILDTTIKSISNLKGNDLTEYYGQGLNFTAKLSDYYGNPISYQRVALNLTRLSSGASKVYWVTTDVNGEYQLPINLAIGSYKIQSLYYGNDSYQGCNCTNSIKVSMMSKISTLISANDFIGDFGVSKNFTGVLKTISGVPISYQRVALNLTRLSSGASKVYWVTTDVNGEYQLPINLSVGIYTILSNYYGSNVFNYDSSIASLIVNS